MDLRMIEAKKVSDDEYTVFINDKHYCRVFQMTNGDWMTDLDGGGLHSDPWSAIQEAMEVADAEQPSSLALGVLDLAMDPESNDAAARNVKQYLGALLLELWREREGFSGKRPFGNSGWEGELYAPLVANGLVTEDDYASGDQLIEAAIKEMSGL